jgi:Ca-activated chloride channel family protein
LIVVLTDGQTTAGPDPIAAARLAAQRGVRVYTVGLGTGRGEILRADGWSMRVGLDESTLKQIADLTRGEYFQAQSAADLKRVYGSLSSRFITEKQEIEIGALIAALATLLTAIAATISMLRSGRIH